MSTKKWQKLDKTAKILLISVRKRISVRFQLGFS